MSLAKTYGNFVSGQLGCTLSPQDIKVGVLGTLATILNGRDRYPAKVAEIVMAKNGKIKGFMLQRYKWTMDTNSEGYAKEIHWDQPDGTPRFHKVRTHGRLKGTVEDAMIGDVDPFYDQSF